MSFKSCSYFFILFLFLYLFSSCASKKDIVYFQNADKVTETTFPDMAEYEIRIYPNDNLLITVSAMNPLVAEPFNVVKLDGGGMTAGLEWRGYLVDESGYINFPVIGKIHIAGLTKDEAIAMLQKRVAEYIESPVVNIRFLNYRISVLGEVLRPSVYTIIDEKISIPDALAMAGDMTILGNRKEVSVYRVENGERRFYTVDMTSPSVFFSPVYYLQQNDILYVQPLPAKARTATFNPYISSAISSLSLMLSIYIAFFK